MLKNLKKLVFLPIFALVFLYSGTSFAAVSISATPVQGSFDLRFGRIDVLNGENKEIRVRVTSTDSKQYQVFQRLVDPLTAQAGSSVEQNALTCYGLMGSNSQGTLYGQTQQYVSLSNQLVYSSPSNGGNDNFTLVYAVDSDRLLQSGQYVGRLQLTARPTGGAESIVYVNIFVDAEFDLRLSIDGADNRKDIVLASTDKDRFQDGLDLEFAGNSGSISIFHEITEGFRSETSGEMFPVEALEFFVDIEGDSALETKYATFSPLFEGRREILSGDSRDGAFRIVYRFNEDLRETLAFGQYFGRIRISADTASSSIEELIDVRISVDKLFALDMEFEPNGMRFDDLLPMSPPQVHAVTVRVKSNISHPYAVRQVVVSPLANEKGVPLEEDYFLIKTEMLDRSEGKGEIPDYSPISQKDQLLYISDENGSPAIFRVDYKVIPYADMSPGRYKAEMAYSLEEL